MPHVFRANPIFPVGSMNDSSYVGDLINKANLNKKFLHGLDNATNNCFSKKTTIISFHEYTAFLRTFFHTFYYSTRVDTACYVIDLTFFTWGDGTSTSFSGYASFL